MKVPYIDLGSQWLSIKDRALPKISEVLESGMYLEHPIVEALEHRIASLLGVKYATTVNSCTDALIFSLVALGVTRGDEVITVPNSYIASVAAIEHIGATTVFIDVGEDHLMDTDLIEEAITPRTKAIMPVHLEGKMANMVEINQIAKKNNLLIIEDAAQAFGSKFLDFQPGNLSDVACFSFHPLKNLNASGDGGLIATNRYEIIEKINRLKNHGQKSRNLSDEFGFVSRLDSIQAAILDIKLDDLKSTIVKRQKNADLMVSLLNSSFVTNPITRAEVFHTYHLFVVEIDNRNFIQTKLKEYGVDSKIHYPILITQQSAYRLKYPDKNWYIPNATKQVNRILSLPIHQSLSDDQIYYVANCLNSLIREA
jgi:dTDP-4-amino-4,6-dideoxygalactose transaminase